MSDYHSKLKLMTKGCEVLTLSFLGEVGPLLSAMDNLMQAEGLLGTGTSTAIVNTLLMIGNFKLDLKQIRIWLGNALRILACGNSVVLL